MIKVIRFLALDVALGAMVSCLFVSRQLEVEMEPAVYFLLGIAVFCIYLFDHFMDEFRKESQGEFRNPVFVKYHKILIVLFFILSVLSVFLAIRILSPIQKYTVLVLSFFTLCYFFLLFVTGNEKYRIFKKEIWIAIIYTSAIWGLPLSLKLFHAEFREWLSLILFFNLVLTNVFIFRYYENPCSRIRKLVNDLLIFALILWINYIIFFNSGGGFYAVLYLLMIASLFISVYFEKYFSKNYIKGFIADAAFILPGLILFIG